MARTKDQSFVNAYLNQYQQNQKNAVSSGQQATSNAASSGVRQMNATGSITLPSVYDPMDDLYDFVLDQQEAQIKAQQEAEKAAQKAEKEAENARMQRIKDNIQNMRDVAKMNREKTKRVQKIAQNRHVSDSSTALATKLSDTTAKTNKQSATSSESKKGATQKGKNTYKTVSRSKVPSRGSDLPTTIRNSTHGRLKDKEQETEEKNAYSKMSTKEKMSAQKVLRTTLAFGTEEEKAQAKKELEAVENALWNDKGYLELVQKSIDDEPEQSRIDRYLDPSYKLNKLEEKDAKEIIKRYRKEASDAAWWFSGATDEQRREALDKELIAYDLEMKVSDLYALESNFAFAIPGVEAATNAAVQMHKGEEYNPNEDSVQAFLAPVRAQSPIASAAGGVGGTLASYAAGSQLVGAIPGVGAGLQSAGQAIGSTRAAQLAAKVPVLGKAFTPEAISGILGDQLVDTVLDTGAGALSSAVQGDKSGAEIAADAARNFGTNLALNVGSAAVLGTAGDVLNRWKANRTVPFLEDDAVNQAVNMGATYEPPPSLYDFVDDAAKAAGDADNAAQSVGNAVPFSLNDFDMPVSNAANDIPLPALENASQVAQSGADDVVNAWRSGTLTNAQLETLKPGGANRAAFEQATGMKLPDTSSETRQFLRQPALDAQQVPFLEPDMPYRYVESGDTPPFLHDGLPESIGAMRHNPRSYAGMQAEYGTIAPGENAARIVDVPISTDGTDRVSASARTFMEAPQTTDELVGMFEKGVEDGLFSHNVKRDADSLARAVSKVEQDGYQKTLEYWKGLMKDGAPLNKEQIVQGQLLYTLAAKNGDTETAMDLAGDLARIATEAGQNLQAQRLLKRMTPEGKLYYARQTVDSFNRQLKQQLGDGFQDIKIPEELARSLMEATDAKAQNDAMQNIYQYVADQLPADWGTRWNAWRYLSMLSNPATHIRNVLSNAVNIPARKFKNLIGAAIESYAVKKGKLDPSQRTKSLLGNSESDKALKAFAKKDLDNVMGDLTGAKKYSDKGEILSRIDPFKINGQWGKTDTSSAVARGARAAADKATGALSWLYRANSNALSAEDMLFKRSAYVDSLAGYLKAQGIDPAKATQKQLDAAREYAVEEALRATYTEYNKLAETLSMIEKRHPVVGKVFLGGVVPFKSTPLNIIRRGVNYSPAGLVANTITGFRNLKNGKITASQFIDNISQGLSGTSIFLIGTWFGMNGYINSVGPENKKEQLLKSGQGFQSYSINLPWGGTYTIDWAGPSAMALLAGAQLGKEFENEDLSFDDVVNAALNVIEPAFDTTMLSGINSAIQSATYAGNNEVVSAATQAFSNFFTQGVPSISGAIARSYDPIRRTVYSESDGAFGKIKENVQRMQNKIPGQSTQNQPYIDVWGREQENPGGNFVGRLAYNMLSPGYYSPDRRTVADDVVEGLYQQTGDTEILPGTFSKSFTVDGEEIRLSPENYTLAKQTKGQASSQMIESLYDYPQYSAIDTEAQADVVKDVYRLANDVAKYQVVPSLYDELVSEIESGDASKSEMLAAMYLTGGAEQVNPYLVADELTSDVSADKNAKGNSIHGSREKNFIETLMQYGYTREEAEYLYQLLK